MLVTAQHPLEAAVDLFVHAPLGLLAKGPRPLDELVRVGRKVAKANQADFERRMLAIEGRVGELLQGLGVVPTTIDDVSHTPTGILTVVPDLVETAAEPAVASEPAGASEPTDDTDAPPAGALALADYDSLSASQVLARLAGMSDLEVLDIGRYEAANRGRKTILAKVAARAN